MVNKKTVIWAMGDVQICVFLISSHISWYGKWNENENCCQGATTFFYTFLIAQQLPYFRFPYFYMGYLNVTNKLKGIQFQACTLFKNINFTYRNHAHTHTNTPFVLLLKVHFLWPWPKRSMLCGRQTNRN